MTRTDYPDTAKPSHGRHELPDEDWGCPQHAVTLYGEITNRAMPVPSRDAPPRHRQVDDLDREV